MILNTRYWLVIATYIFIQFSGYLFGFELMQRLGFPKEDAGALWLVLIFTLGLIITFLLLLPEIKNRYEVRGRVSRLSAVLWSILGVFMALAAQSFAAMFEFYVLDIDPGSENTEMLIEVAKATPIFIVVTSILGPIFEEIIFRKIIFGSLYKRYNFWIGAIVSSLVFAAVHFDFAHIIIYTAMGFTFAFLYVKTKRILVPIIAHVMMNTLVVLIQVIFVDDIQKMQQQVEQIQAMITTL